MDKKQKIDAIYEAMADKTLSDGCVIYHSSLYRNTIVSLGINRHQNVFPQKRQLVYHSSAGHIASLYYDTIDDISTQGWDIIGHPVRIGDVLDYCDSELMPKGEHSLYFYISSIIDFWKNKRLPIDEQSDDAISFVYNLIKK